MKHILILRLKYPKLLLLLVCIIAAYFLFHDPLIRNLLGTLQDLSYVGIVFSGILYAFGFTSPFAVGSFIVLNPSNILLAAVIGGIGALTADMFIFNYIKMTFIDEFKMLSKEKPVQFLNRNVKKIIPKKIRMYFAYFIAAILIGSPLPDEIGVTLISGLTKIKPLIMGIISFTLNTLGILIILLLSR